MKTNFVMIIFIFISLDTFSQGWKWIEDTKELRMIECTDRELIDIIDSIFTKEEVYNYYADSLVLSIVITKNNIWFKTSYDRTILFENSPLGYFYKDKHLCLVYHDIGEKFRETEEKKIFYYKKFIYDTTKRKDKIPNVMNEDGEYFSCWIYRYKDLQLIPSVFENFYTGEYIDYEQFEIFKELSK
jgi:hypothetical protein